MEDPGCFCEEDSQKKNFYRSCMFRMLLGGVAGRGRDPHNEKFYPDLKAEMSRSDLHVGSLHELRWKFIFNQRNILITGAHEQNCFLCYITQESEKTYLLWSDSRLDDCPIDDLIIITNLKLHGIFQVM